MFRTAKLLTGSLLLCSPAAAQALEAVKFDGPIKHAGVLRLSDHTWNPATRQDPDPGSTLGSTIYNNDAFEGHYLKATPWAEYGDWGRVPGPYSVAPEVGNRSHYKINGFEFAYVTNKMKGNGYVVSFYESFRPCYSDPSLYPTVRIFLWGLPGAPAPGQTTAWKVAVDLRGGNEFCLAADGGDEGFDDYAQKDSFSFSLTELGQNPSINSGPILAGDPAGVFGPAAEFGDGTVWHGNQGVPGTGLGTQDTLWDTPVWMTGQNCKWITNNADVYASFHFELYADLAAPPCGSTFSTVIGTPYCTPAVPNSTGHAGQMIVTGSDLAEADKLRLWATSLPPSKTAGYFLMGTGQNTSQPPGSLGPQCVGGGELYRLWPLSMSSELPGGFERWIGTHGQYGAQINPGSTWNFQAWYRDYQFTSNLTDAVSVTFK